MTRLTLQKNLKEENNNKSSKRVQKTMLGVSTNQVEDTSSSFAPLAPASTVGRAIVDGQVPKKMFKPFKKIEKEGELTFELSCAEE